MQSMGASALPCFYICCNFSIVFYSHFGNIARFLNHSCQPNVEKVSAFTDSQDVRIPRYALRGSLCFDLYWFILYLYALLLLELPCSRTGSFPPEQNCATTMGISKEMSKGNIVNACAGRKSVEEICISWVLSCLLGYSWEDERVFLLRSVVLWWLIVCAFAQKAVTRSTAEDRSRSFFKSPYHFSA